MVAVSHRPYSFANRSNREGAKDAKREKREPFILFFVFLRVLRAFAVQFSIWYTRSALSCRIAWAVASAVLPSRMSHSTY